MNAVFVLWHSRDLGEGETDDKLVGVYSSEVEAQAAITRKLAFPGFDEHPDGFSISRYELNRGCMERGLRFGGGLSMKDWDDATAYARTLPDVVMESWWGTPCPKINGKGLMSPGREKGSFGLMVTHPEKEMLFETDPDTFWQTDHYANYPMLLVRYGTASRERIELYIQRAWWDRAKKPQRLAAGMEERP